MKIRDTLAGPRGRLAHPQVISGKRPELKVPDTPAQIPWTSWPAAVDKSGRVNWRVVWEHGFPRRGLPAEINRWRARNLRWLLPSLWRAGRPRLGRGPLTGALFVDVVRADGRHLPYGLASLDMVMIDGVKTIVDCWHGQDLDLQAMQYHGVGSSTTPNFTEFLTTLVSEVSTVLNPDGLRGVGSLAEGPGGSNVLRTVGSNLYDQSASIAEWGLFDQHSVGGGDLFDRAVFGAMALDPGDSTTWTFDCTFPAGG